MHFKDEPGVENGCWSKDGKFCQDIVVFLGGKCLQVLPKHLEMTFCPDCNIEHCSSPF